MRNNSMQKISRNTVSLHSCGKNGSTVIAVVALVLTLLGIVLLYDAYVMVSVRTAGHAFNIEQFLGHSKTWFGSAAFISGIVLLALAIKKV